MEVVFRKMPQEAELHLKSSYAEVIAVPEGVELARSWRDILQLFRPELFADG
jgi:hypothetical protein